MKKLHLIAFYALIAPAIALGAQHDGQSQAFIGSLPAGAVMAGDLIGTELKTSDGEVEGAINNLIINDNGKVEAVLVNSGEFLGLGEQSRAVSWDAIQMPDTLDDRRPKAPSNLTVE